MAPVEGETNNQQQISTCMIELLMQQLSERWMKTLLNHQFSANVLLKVSAVLLHTGTPSTYTWQMSSSSPVITYTG